MKVIQYTNISYSFPNGSTPSREESKRYEIDISQEQLDIIVAVMGSVVGLGEIRKLTDSIYEGLERHSTNDDDIPYGQKSMKDYFKETELHALKNKTSEASIHIGITEKNTVYVTADQSPECDNIKVTFDSSGKPIKAEIL